MNKHARRLDASLLSALALCLWVAAARSQDNTLPPMAQSETVRLNSQSDTVRLNSQSETVHLNSQNEPMHPISLSDTLRRLTVTPEQALNLNPTLSGDGRRVAFESNAHPTGASRPPGFHTLRVDLSAERPDFADVAATRAPAPALSRDGSHMAFASRENLTGENSDGNSEIFLFADERLRQITHTSPGDPAQRAGDGNFQPSISDDGSLVAFASNRDLTGANADANLEIFLFDAAARAVTQITDTTNPASSIDAKISGDGARIAFIRDSRATDGEASQPRDLLLYERADNSTRVVAGDVPELSFTYGRAVSTDGQRVVYSARTAARTTQVFLYDGRNEQIRQLTSLGSRAADVPLHPTISGDGSRVAFATRRSVSGGNPDASVELYVYDLPGGKFSRVTDAPSRATAEVVASLNEDGSLVAFNFPRVLGEPISDDAFANNSEIYVAGIEAAPAGSTGLQILHGASHGKEPAAAKAVAPDQIAIAKGVNLALNATRSQRQADGTFPLKLGGASLSVNGRPAQLFYASPTRINFHVPPETETGTALVVVRNHDGHESRAFVTVLRAAPGVFTESGDGGGTAIALDAQTALRSPFDPADAANQARRLIIFSTGVRHAASVGVSIGGRSLVVERVLPSPDLPGLDEIHVLLTRSLAGAGIVPLVVRADGREANPANINFHGTRRAASITLAPATASAGIGRSVRFAASVRDADGVEITSAPVAFHSSDESIASIEASGVARGRQAGTVTLTATSGEVSATAQLTIYPLALVVNEVLADPPDGAAGDANHDGTRSSTDDEFIELVNASTIDLNIGGYQLTTRGASGADTVRHTFAADTIVAPGTALVVFGGAQAATFDAQHPAFAGALVLIASTGGLSLTNNRGVVKLLDPSGTTVEQISYGGAGEPAADRNQSLTRAPDVTGDFTAHETAPGSGGRSLSPGTRIDAAPFINPVPIARIEVEPQSAIVESGRVQRFTARAFDANGTELPGVVYRWRSADPAVATIDSDGLARSATAGDTQITATARGVQSTPATLRVLARRPTIARVEITPQAASINRGGTIQFSARAFDPDGRAVGDAAFSWSSADALIASIDSAGLARGGGLGTTTIAASTSDGAGGTVAGRASLEVRVPLVLNEILADVPPDDPATKAVEGDANRDGARSSDDDEFIELLNYSQSPVDISGLVVADATARRYTFPAGTMLAGKTSLVIFGGSAPPRGDPAFGGSVILTAASLGLNDAGDTLSLKLTVGATEFTIASQSYGTAGADAPPAPVDQSLTRSPDAASDATGGDFVPHSLVTDAAARPFSPGTRVDGTPFDSPPLTRLSVEPAAATIEIGASRNFRARAYTTLDGVEREINNVSFVWDSSEPGKAQVAPASGAETTAQATASGSLMIRARAGALEAAAILTVNPPPPVLTRVSLTPDAATIIVGDAGQFTARAFDQYERPFPVASFDFASDDPAVASLESVEHSPASGEARATFRGRAGGTAHVTAAATNDGRSASSNTAALTVNSPPPSIARIEITPQSATVAVGASRKFDAKAYDRNNQEMPGVVFNWTTSDAAIATIDASGLATGRAAGTTGVTASSAHVTSAPATLTVSPPPAATAGQIIINEALVAFATSSGQVRRDFVELHNTTGQTLDITGLVLTFRPSGSGNTPQSLALGNAAGDKFLIEPHGYFLIAGGTETFGGRVDFNAGSFDLNNTTGGIKIEIGGVKSDGFAYQGGATPPSASFSAFGEGAIFTFTSGTTNDLIRSPNGVDTNHNATDFRRNGTASSVSPKAANP